MKFIIFRYYCLKNHFLMYFLKTLKIETRFENKYLKICPFNSVSKYIFS